MVFSRMCLSSVPSVLWSCNIIARMRLLYYVAHSESQGVWPGVEVFTLAVCMHPVSRVAWAMDSLLEPARAAHLNFPLADAKKKKKSLCFDMLILVRLHGCSSIYGRQPKRVPRWPTPTGEMKPKVAVEKPLLFMTTNFSRVKKYSSVLRWTARDVPSLVILCTACVMHVVSFNRNLRWVCQPSYTRPVCETTLGVEGRSDLHLPLV